MCLRINAVSILFAVFAVVIISACIEKQFTVSDIVEKKAELLNQNISVEGTAGLEKLRCTLIACSETNPCCNSCGGSLALSDGKAAIEIRGQYEGKSVACSGNECSQTCYPMEKGKKYIVAGTLREDSGLYIELKGYRESE